MNTGVRMSLLAGPVLPVPLPGPFAARVRSVTVTESDQARSAFSITLDAGRTGPTAAFDTPVLGVTPIRANARVVVILTMGVVPTVLADGIVTETSLMPGSASEPAELTVTGQDVSVLLDRHEVSAEHIGLEDSLQVRRIAASYLPHRVLSNVIPPPVMDPPLPIERTPTQQDTDWEHLQALATFHGYVCYMAPGPLPGASTLYWGPPVRQGAPQPALSVDLGAHTNVVGSPRFREDVLGPELVEGQSTDPRLGETLPVRTVASLRPPLSALPSWAVHRADLRTRQFRESGLSAVTAQARAQAITERSVDSVVAEGTLDGGAYGAVLRPRALVGMRGAGWHNDGTWYVKQVVHRVARGSYSADFTLTREGFGATSPTVRI